MAVCAACNSRIFLGGTSWGSLTCCDDACVVKLKTELTRAMVPANELEQEVERVHGGACPECGGEGPNDVYTAKKVTGMLVAVQWAEDKHVCCCACGKKAKWKAALHCATLGWWSPKALLTNLVYLPWNIVGAIAFTKPALRPSKTLDGLVCQIVADANMAKFIAAYREAKAKTAAKA